MVTPQQEALLKNWYCANPACSGKGREGKPHLILKARLSPGSLVRVKCRYCRKWTTIVISDQPLDPNRGSVRKS